MYRFASLVCLAAATAALAPSAEQADAPEGPKQPIPFSHKIHVGMGLKCLDCHAMKDPGFAAGYPKEATCMACHAAVKTDSPHIRRLAEYEKKNEAVPWVKVYRVPDYVYFSHAFHHQDAGVACGTCHGPVAERDVIAREKPVTMAACMSCHDKTGAPNECDLCHDTF